MNIFPFFEFSSAGIKIGVWINSAGLNNLGRPKFELDYAREKFGVLTGPYMYAQFKRPSFHVPNLIPSSKYMKRSMFEHI